MTQSTHTSRHHGCSREISKVDLLNDLVSGACRSKHEGDEGLELDEKELQEFEPEQA